MNGSLPAKLIDPKSGQSRIQSVETLILTKQEIYPIGKELSVSFDVIKIVETTMIFVKYISDNHPLERELRCLGEDLVDR